MAKHEVVGELSNDSREVADMVRRLQILQKRHPEININSIVVQLTSSYAQMAEIMRHLE